jgi:hypothetical protein
MPAARVLRILGERVWAEYFKITIERNPWDKAISLYFWRTRDMHPRPPLLEYLGAAKTTSLSNFDIYSINGTLAVDRVIRYESLEADLDQVRRSLGIPEPITLPRAKGQHRNSSTHYSQLLGVEGRAIVEKACAREIALFNYRFEELS